MPDRSLILDTCALLWLASGSRRLSAHVRNVIDAAPVVYVSAISAWEIGLKVVRGDLGLPLPPKEWFRDAVRNHDLVVVDLDADILMAANELPWHHRDPADRFILATARKHSLAIVTADARFAAYGVPILA